MKRTTSAILVVLLVMTLPACVRVKRPATQPTVAPPGASLWERPTDLRSRDLFLGPWGAENAPNPRATYTLVEYKHSGVNPGMTVVDSQGREWSVKQPIPGGLDFEGPVEVAVSRLLSAVGYHQPPVYFLPTFTLKDDWGTRTEVGGRFRLKLDGLKEADAWSWQENPFVGTEPYQGLLAILMLFNSTDLKNSNNSLYERKVGNRVEQWYVVRDTGAALGDTLRWAPRKGHPSAFERHPYILGVSNGRVDFAYRGWYRKLVEDRITPDELRWAMDLLGGLSDRQWQDAFRAGGYAPDVANQFIRAMKQKIAEGRAVGRRVANE
jgi:hypothetical protein